MTLTASSISTNNTLEQLRTEFNNLVTDVGFETGTKAFSSITATTSSSTLNVLEDGNIIFEGATDDANETTLTVADPTADRTITLFDSTGTVVVSGDGSFTVAYKRWWNYRVNFFYRYNDTCIYWYCYF